MNASSPGPEKKTAETSAAALLADARGQHKTGALGTSDFRVMGGEPQTRYEALRAYMLLPSFQRPRTTPVRFDIGRVERFGLLGLLERDPVGAEWAGGIVGDFQVQLIPVGTAIVHDRWAGLLTVLSDLIATSPGGTHDPCCALRPRLDRNAGERTDHSEPTERDHAVR